MAKTVLGIFTVRQGAEDAINELKDLDYNPKDVSIVLRDKQVKEEVEDNTGANVAGGAVSGAAAGILLGGLAGLVASIAIPGLGAFFIGGPIAASLGLTGAAATTASGATTGALAGGILGALSGFGLSDDEAKYYEERVNSGGILVAVPVRGDESGEVEDIFRKNDASDIKTIDSRV